MRFNLTILADTGPMIWAGILADEVCELVDRYVYGQTAGAVYDVQIAPAA